MVKYTLHVKFYLNCAVPNFLHMYVNGPEILKLAFL